LKKSRFRVFRAVFLFLVFFSATGIFLSTRYLKTLERTVTAKFQDPKYKIPSKIYSDPFLLYLGMNLRMKDLRTKIRRLDYRESRKAPAAKGEYRFLKRHSLLEIYLHDFAYPLESFKGIPVRIALQGTTIQRMEKMTSGEELFSIELEPELVTGLYDRTWQQRRLVKLVEVPPLLVRAILAIEDERFYRHRGIDPIAILRASWVNLRSGGIVQGGSTITQQLIKNWFLTSEQTYQRKFSEALMAFIAERKFSKEEILENYLNEIYLGQKGAQGIFGVWEAAPRSSSIAC